ncbi:MAG: hypothetical protein ABJB86_15340 [Bacteroidota bacterium]
MTKIFSAKFWIILISSCCTGAGIVLACADGWGEEYGVSNFSPEIFVDSAYSPFFYSYQFYYKIGHEEDQDARFNNNNTSEWSAFFKNQIAKEELDFLLQKATTGSVDSTINYMSGKSNAIPLSMQSFKIVTKKSDAKINAFFSYLKLAKKCEDFALNNITGSWDFEDKSKNKKNYNATALNAVLLNSFIKSNDIFLKERYWFQLERSYFFNTGAQQAISFFTANEKSMPHDNMYYRTMAYAAGGYYTLKNYSKANYYYSRVYENCDVLKTAAHYSFHPQEEKDWNATLGLCINNNEKATLWQMLGIFYADEQRAIKEIYQLTPASDKLDVLLARAVNKYEQKFNITYRNADMPVDTVAMPSLPALVTKIATAGNTGQPWIWQMAAGYLGTLDKKYADADAWFAKAEKKTPNTKPAQAQLRLLKMINTIAQARRIDSKLESRVLNDIEWLKDFDAKDMPQLRYSDAFAWLRETMAAKYLRQKDLVKSECFSSRVMFYADNQNIEALKTFLGKSGKTNYEKLCADLSVKKMADLFEFQAIHLTYADSIDAAIEKMEKSGAGATTELPGNPFNGRIQDCHDCDHAAAQKIKYSKLSFLKKLQEIKSKINAGEDVYMNAILLANAHYNITHFGNARIFYECKIVGESHSDPYFIDSLFRKMLTGTVIATKYYTLALKNTATDEQRAKCQYMLAKCERNQWYNVHVYNKTDGYTEEKLVDYSALDGFKILKQYAATQYYKDVIKECGYFRTYVGGKKSN